MASAGLGTLREVVVQSSQAGRLRVDLALLQREKQQLLALLGEQVAKLLDDGQLEVPDDVRATYERACDIDARIKTDSVKAHDNAYGAPRGYEPEAGNYMNEHEPADEPLEPDELDEHAEVAGTPAKKDSRSQSRKGDSR